MLERRVERLEAQLERYMRSVLLRGVIVRGDPDTFGPYTVRLIDVYGHDTYINGVLYQPFGGGKVVVTMQNLDIPNSEPVEIETNEFDVSIDEHGGARTNTGFSSGHSHSVSAPRLRHSPNFRIKINPVRPKAGDKVLVFSPFGGNASAPSMIIGSW